MTTLEKVKRFERYLKLTGDNADKTVDAVLEKLLERKREELKRQREEMEAELAAFEEQYGMKSSQFYEKFERGEIGDAADFFDWSATWQMYNSVQKYLHALSNEPLAV